jgi:glycosyltransferase involved in cell wall biosynthesis
MAEAGRQAAGAIDRRPRVLLVGHGAPTRGGIPTFLAELVDDGWLGGQVDLRFLNTAPKGRKVPGAMSPANLGRTLVHTWRVFGRARRADVVHLNLAATPTLPLARAFALSSAARLAGARPILHAHTGLLEVCVRRRLFRVVLRATLGVVDRFVVVSGDAEAAVRAVAGRAAPKVLRVGNGLDLDRVRPGDKDVDPPILAFVGTVCERKGLIDLRDALRMLRNGDGRLPFRVVVVGDGEQEGPASFQGVRAAYREAGLEEVEFTGALPRERVIDLLSRASVFCLPSHTEGFPLSLLEAMGAGAASVATRVGDVPFMVEGGRSGILVEAKDVEGLCRALARLASDVEERTRLGVAARERVEREFDQRRVLARLVEIYRGSSPQAPVRRGRP